jgi:hypothetical protein
MPSGLLPKWNHGVGYLSKSQAPILHGHEAEAPSNRGDKHNDLPALSSLLLPIRNGVMVLVAF